MAVSIPPPTERIVPRDTVMEPWYRAFDDMARAINDTETNLESTDANLADVILDLANTTADIDDYLAAPVLPIYTVGTLPTAATVGRLIYVSNESGGAVPAFSDGVNWRRVTDRAIVT